jgi:uncharacterized protein (DUF433 family)
LKSDLTQAKQHSGLVLAELEGEEVKKLEKLNRITVDPNVCLGQPTIRGMRITVSVILKMLASGKSIQEVIEAYPELEVEDVHQATKYAAWIVPDQIHMMPTT